MVQTLSMRTKLLMAALSLTASFALMAVTADTADAQVTEITRVYNQTDKEIYIWNHESGVRIEGILPAKKSYAPFNEWVPWTTRADDFDAGHYIEVGYMETFYECGGIGICPRFSFWQEYRKSDGDKIRYTGQNPPDGPVKYRSYAEPIPGASSTGGRRTLYIKNLGNRRLINIDVELKSG